METLGALIGMAGLAIVAYALFRKFKSRDLSGKPFWLLTGAGVLVLMLGGAIIPDEAVTGGPAAAGESHAAAGQDAPRASANDLLAGIADATLASRDEGNMIMPSPLGQTLGDTWNTLNEAMDCTLKRNGGKLTIDCRNDRGHMIIDFTLANVEGIGKSAIIETLAIDTSMSDRPRIVDSAEAHATLMGIIQAQAKPQPSARTGDARQDNQNDFMYKLEHGGLSKH